MLLSIKLLKQTLIYPNKVERGFISDLEGIKISIDFYWKDQVIDRIFLIE